MLDKISTKIARVGGLELVDSQTGDVYCAWIENGEWIKVQGECDAIKNGR